MFPEEAQKVLPLPDIIDTIADACVTNFLENSDPTGARGWMEAHSMMTPALLDLIEQWEVVENEEQARRQRQDAQKALANQRLADLKSSAEQAMGLGSAVSTLSRLGASVGQIAESTVGGIGEELSHLSRYSLKSVLQDDDDEEGGEGGVGGGVGGGSGDDSECGVETHSLDDFLNGGGESAAAAETGGEVAKEEETAAKEVTEGGDEEDDLMKLISSGLAGLDGIDDGDVVIAGASGEPGAAIVAAGAGADIDEDGGENSGAGGGGDTAADSTDAFANMMNYNEHDNDSDAAAASAPAPASSEPPPAPLPPQPYADSAASEAAPDNSHGDSKELLDGLDELLADDSMDDFLDGPEI
jgi:hypothetical protein